MSCPHPCEISWSNHCGLWNSSGLCALQLSWANAHVSRDTPPSRALHSYAAIVKPLERQGGITATGEMLTVCVSVCVKGKVFLTQTASLATNQVFRWSVQYSTQHPRPPFPHPLPSFPTHPLFPHPPPFPNLWTAVNIFNALLTYARLKTITSN